MTTGENDTSAALEPGIDIKTVKEGDSVYCRADGQLYLSKVLKLEGDSAFVHFQGWKSRYDAWVSAFDMMPDCIEAEGISRELKMRLVQSKREAAEKKRIKGKGKGKGKRVAGSEKPIQRRTKRQKANLSETTASGTGSQYHIALPVSLKRRLVDDWEAMTQAPLHLVKLPREVTVSDLLEAYLEFTSINKRSEAALAAAKEAADSLILYFDKVLPMSLLYAHEKKQYLCLKRKARSSSLEPRPSAPSGRGRGGVRGKGKGRGRGRGKTEKASLPANTGTESKIVMGPIDGDFAPSRVYGPEHLLRLFTKFPEMLEEAHLTDIEKKRALAMLRDVVKYMADNQKDIFLDPLVDYPSANSFEFSDVDEEEDDGEDEEEVPSGTENGENIQVNGGGVNVQAKAEEEEEGGKQEEATRASSTTEIIFGN